MATLTNKNGTDANDILTYDKGASTVVYHAGAGNDKVTITGGAVKLNLDSGTNTITITGGALHEITGGTGTGVETLKINGGNTVTASLGSGKDVIEITNSNGKKTTGALSTIRGGDWTDTFTVKAGTQGYQLYGEAGNDIFNVEAGKNMVYWGGAANDTFNITGGTGKYYGGDSADTFTVSVSGQDLILGYGNDVVNIEAGDNQKIKANLGINEINLKAGSGHVITADIDQAASKKQGYTDEQIKAGQGIGYGVDKVNIYAGVSQVTANLGDGKDEVIVQGTGHSIYTEGWGDKVALYDAEACYIDAGAGDDAVAGIKMKESLIYLREGDDVFEISAWSNCSKSQVYGGEGKDKFIIGGGTQCEFRGEAGDDRLEISGGLKNNFYGDEGNDLIIIKGGSQNGVWSGTGEDTILVEGKTENCLIRGGSDGDIIDVSLEGSVNASFITSDSGMDTLNIRGEGNMIASGNGMDILTVYGDKNLVYGGADNDSIRVDGVNNLVYGGNGNDSFIVEAKNNTCYGGANADEFKVVKKGSVNNFALLVGGAGNDTYRVQDQDNVWIDAYSGAAATDKDVIIIESSKNMMYGYRYDASLGALGIGGIYVQGIRDISEIRFVEGTKTVKSFTGLEMLQYALKNNIFFDEVKLNYTKLDYGEKKAAVAAEALGDILEPLFPTIKNTMVEIAAGQK